MKYQKGTLEYVKPFEATTEQIVAAVAEERRTNPNMFRSSGSWGRDIATMMHSPEFAHQVNYCMLFVSMFTRQPTCTSTFRKHDAEQLGKGDVSYIPAVAVFTAIALMQFPRAYDSHHFSVGVPLRELEWIFDVANGQDARKNNRGQPPRWGDFIDARDEFSVRKDRLHENDV